MLCILVINLLHDFWMRKTKWSEQRNTYSEPCEQKAQFCYSKEDMMLIVANKVCRQENCVIFVV